MNQIIIQYPNDVIIDYVHKNNLRLHKNPKVNHYLFVVNPLKVFAFSGEVFDSEKDDVLPIETTEMVEQALALLTLGLSALEIKEALFGE